MIRNKEQMDQLHKKLMALIATMEPMAAKHLGIDTNGNIVTLVRTEDDSYSLYYENSAKNRSEDGMIGKEVFDLVMKYDYNC